MNIESIRAERETMVKAGYSQAIIEKHKYSLSSGKTLEIDGGTERLAGLKNALLVMEARGLPDAPIKDFSGAKILCTIQDWSELVILMAENGMYYWLQKEALLDSVYALDNNSTLSEINSIVWGATPEFPPV